MRLLEQNQTLRTLNQIAGCEVFLKCENFQRVGAFKFRGAYNAISQLTPAQKSAGVITHSSGNHAQGLALAARLAAPMKISTRPAIRGKRFFFICCSFLMRMVIICSNVLFMIRGALKHASGFSPCEAELKTIKLCGLDE